MKRVFFRAKHTVLRSLGGIIIVGLAFYSIWYCQTALAPFSELRRVTTLDERLRLSLFQTESAERGYLLTGNRDSISSYEHLKQGLLAQLGLFVVELDHENEPDLARQLDNHVRQRMEEMDHAIAAWQGHNTALAAKIVRANIESRHTADICNDLDMITAIERSRNIIW